MLVLFLFTFALGLYEAPCVHITHYPLLLKHGGGSLGPPVSQS